MRVLTHSKHVCTRRCIYPFIVVEQQSTGLQCSEVESALKVVKRWNLCCGTEVTLSREISFARHLSRRKHISVAIWAKAAGLHCVLSVQMCTIFGIGSKGTVTLCYHLRCDLVDAQLTKDSSGQPLLIPMVPGSSSRLKSFFWNWNPFTQPFRPTTEDSSGLWEHIYFKFKAARNKVRKLKKKTLSTPKVLLLERKVQSQEATEKN